MDERARRTQMFVGLPVWVAAMLVLTCATSVTAQGDSGVGGAVAVEPPREDTVETARGLATASGLRASASGTNAVAYNAANMGLLPSYQIEAFGGFVPGESSWQIGTTIADGTTGRVAIGSNIRGVFAGGDSQYKGLDWRSTVGVTIMERLAVGIGTRWGRIRGRTNAFGDKIGPSFHGFTMDTALRVTAARWLHIAALGYNVIKTHSPLAPRLLGGSVSIQPVTGLDIGGDVFVDMTTFDSPQLIWGAAAEYAIVGSYPIRAGFRRDEGRSQNQIGFGLGFTKQELGIDFGMRMDIQGAKQSQMLVNIRYNVR